MTIEHIGASREEQFAALCEQVEPGLRRALVAAFGPDVGGDAVADSLAWAWEHFERTLRLRNPGGYLYRVGMSSAKRALRSSRRHMAWPTADVAGPESWHVEPALAAAMARLSVRQRTAVLLVYGYGYSLREAADVLACRPRTLRTHLERGMSSIRSTLGDDHG